MTPNPIFVTGLYDPHDASKGDNLNAEIAKVWHNWGINLATSVYDRDLMALIPKTGPIPVLIGHSFGGAAIVDLAWRLYNALDKRPLYVLLIDPVNNNKIGFGNGAFTLPPSAVKAYDIYRRTRSDGSPITNYFSSPLTNGENKIYVPKLGASKDANGNPQDPQAVEHGEKVWDVATANKCKEFMALASAPTPIIVPPPDQPPVASGDVMARLTAIEQRLDRAGI